MPKVTLSRFGEIIGAESDETLMEALTHAGRPVASSCQGEGICGRCRIRIITGFDHLTEETSLEARRRADLAIPEDERLSCQTYVLGDVAVDAPYW